MKFRVMNVTVIIPTLNEAARIGALLRALQAQSYAPLEIIVCDGDSDDGTPEIVRQFENVTLLECERGTSTQRNYGGTNASGELLIFMDADDLPSPRFRRQKSRAVIENFRLLWPVLGLWRAIVGF